MNNEENWVTMDGNQAAAHVAYRVNEVSAIYPITPSSSMAELFDEWATQGLKNIWGQIPDIISMQSEAGAAGAVHGALQTGGLTTTFTASQGLMLMLPNMYKIAGELTPTVFHVAARALATQGLSIFGDHSDVMAARMTGFAMLASASVQESHDMALIAQAATLKSRIPFMHFFDGFRTSHEINKVHLLSDEQISAMIDPQLVLDHQNRALNPDNPFIRGTAQNPDVYFQSRETVNPFYAKTPKILEELFSQFENLTGRSYELIEYHGAPDAEKLIIIMASGAETAAETAEYLNNQGEKVGVIQIRLYRPFSNQHLLDKIPATVRKIAVLDRTKEPGASGEPLYQDVLTALTEAYNAGTLEHLPKMIGGRYGLSSKEFTPAMVKGIYDELGKDAPKNHFTIGINDDVSFSSLDYPSEFHLSDEGTQALFYGLGADGTVSANKNSIKIIGENTDLFAQGYFVYDSKKSGSQTVSHLRFGPKHIKAPYLVEKADFIACHNFNFVEKVEMLNNAKDNAIFLLNTPYSKEQVWDQLPKVVQEIIIEKKLRFYVIDAAEVAKITGMGRRINTIMQTCFFAISEILPAEEAISKIKEAIEKTYARKGAHVIQQNFQAVDATVEHLSQVELPESATSVHGFGQELPEEAPEFVRRVTAKMMENRGDDLPVSALPVDGTYPSGTTRWEKRNISDMIPEWREDICIQCGNCSFVCPHSVIRAKFYHEDVLQDAPECFPSAPINARGFPETRYTLQVYAEDCTGCQLCVEACPAHSLKESGVKAINMRPKEPILEREKTNIDFFENIEINDRSQVDFASVRGSQFLEPLFEFSGACAGCGETPYVRLLSQLFGDRMVVANATGCSSIYGGNLPTTPWTQNKQGQGPAWSNSLFEDNAEFGLGMRVALDQHFEYAANLLKRLKADIDETLIDEILNSSQLLESEIVAQRVRVGRLKESLEKIESEDAKLLLPLVDNFVRRSVWLLGGDGWAYDIGSGGLDHVLASGRNVNVLVLDTEVYSNTGGQASKATPTAATAKFASAGKRVGKKDLALQAISYGNVYVAQVAMGANPQQTLLAMREAESYPGPSLILAYSHCIAHGINMQKGLDQQKMATQSAYWPLLRYNPTLRKAGDNPFVLDSPRPTVSFRDYAYNELRYKILERSHPKEAKQLIQLAQELVDLRWKTYENMSQWPASEFQPVA